MVLLSSTEAEVFKGSVTGWGWGLGSENSNVLESKGITAISIQGLQTTPSFFFFFSPIPKFLKEWAMLILLSP